MHELFTCSQHWRSARTAAAPRPEEERTAGAGGGGGTVPAHMPLVQMSFSVLVHTPVGFVSASHASRVSGVHVPGVASAMQAAYVLALPSEHVPASSEHAPASPSSQTVPPSADRMGQQPGRSGPRRKAEIQRLLPFREATLWLPVVAPDRNHLQEKLAF